MDQIISTWLWILPCTLYGLNMFNPYKVQGRMEEIYTSIHSYGQIMVKLSIIPLMTLLIFIKPAFTKDLITLDLKKAILLAERSDTVLKALQFNRKVFMAQSKTAERALYPKFTTELKRTKAVTFSNPRGATILTFDNSLEIPIYDRALIYRKRKAKSELLLNRFQIENRLNNLTKEIYTLYYSILNLKALIRVRKQEYVKARQSYRFTKKKLKHKRVLPLDLLLNEGLMRQTRNDWIKAQHDYKEEKLNLLQKLDVKENIRLTKDNTLLWGIKSRKESLKIAMSQRGELKEIEIQKKVRQEAYEIERSILYPKISLFSDLKLTGVDNTEFKDRTDWSIFVTISLALIDDVTLTPRTGVFQDFRLPTPTDEQSLTLSIFDGSSNRNLRTRTRADYKNIYYEIKDLKARIKREIVSAYHDIIEAKNTLLLARLNLKIGKGLVRKAKVELRLGKKGLEEVMVAKEKNIRYRVEFQQAILNYQLAVLNLKWATGILWSEQFNPENIFFK